MILNLICTLLAIQDGGLAIPPTLGDLTSTGAHVLCKASDETPLALQVVDDAGTIVFSETIAPSTANDFLDVDRFSRLLKAPRRLCAFINVY